MRFGQTELTGSARAVLPDDLGFVDGNVLGLYLHGLVENAGLLEAITGRRPRRSLPDVFEALADLVEEHVDLDAILPLD